MQYVGNNIGPITLSRGVLIMSIHGQMAASCLKGMISSNYWHAVPLCMQTYVCTVSLDCCVISKFVIKRLLSHDICFLTSCWLSHMTSKLSYWDKMQQQQMQLRHIIALMFSLCVLHIWFWSYLNLLLYFFSFSWNL